MKAGIVFSDMVNTVSPSYALEIQTPEFGSGLDGLLRQVSHKLTGIVNGIDTSVWDPANDPLLAHHFSPDDLSGKNLCKKDLQQRLSLDDSPGPLFGMISRLVDQKGIDLVISIIERIVSSGGQVAILGSGDKWHEEALRNMALKHKGRLGVYLGFDEGLAHVIEAGSDFFLMPSRFEPCGLNQMISMRYGTIPIVTCVGGLKDTVTALGEGDPANGLRVLEPTKGDLLNAVEEACAIYKDKPELLATLRKNAMEKNVDWTHSALQYYSMYNKLKDFRERTRLTEL